jgi:hypothetical protein
MGEAFIVRKGGAGGVFGSDIEAGLIVMYYGLDTDIPFGWDLCDGTKGNPDLRNLFIVGAGDTYTVESTGGSVDGVIIEHTHNGTVVNHGGHTHTITASFGANSVWTRARAYGSGSISVSTNASGAHTHAYTSSTDGVTATNANLPPYYGLYYIIKLEEN